MEKRKLNENYTPSLLGFGCMRFPVNAEGKIDRKEAEKMLDYAITHGVNYIDTAFPYHNQESEPFVGKVLKKYNRDSFYLTTKMPLWFVNSIEEAEAMFENQLQRLDVDYVDFYLLHALDKEKWEKTKRLGILEYLDKMKMDGRLRNLGFSFHDEYEVFEEIIQAYPWDFCQIQYNYVDREEQAGDKGYALAEKLGIPLIIMEPIKGGSLAVLPNDLADKLKQHAPNQSISSWALRWVASHSNVKVILSGMSTFDQVVDNVKTFANFKCLTIEEEALIEEIAHEIKARTMNGCTGCEYCMPCPFGVNIPKNFRIWNDFSKYGNYAVTRKAYYEDLKCEEQSSMCKQCGKCEALCPQHIAIRDDLKRVAQDMETKIKSHE